MALNHRIATDGGDWMRDVERRMTRQERRPEPTSLADQFGVGISQRARHIVDWNDPQTLRNGWYYTDVFGINSPNPEVAWLGEVIVTFDGHGVQQLWSHTHSSKPVGYVRQFHFHEGAIMPDFTEWAQFSGPMGGLRASCQVAQFVPSHSSTHLVNWQVDDQVSTLHQSVQYSGAGVFSIRRTGWYAIHYSMAMPSAEATGTSYGMVVGLSLNGAFFVMGSGQQGSSVSTAAQLSWEGHLTLNDLIRPTIHHTAGTATPVLPHTSGSAQSFLTIRQVAY